MDDDPILIEREIGGGWWQFAVTGLGFIVVLLVALLVAISGTGEILDRLDSYQNTCVERTLKAYENITSP